MELSSRDERVMRLAQIGYEGYCAKTGWKSAVSGDNLPQWQELPGAVKNAWFSAAKAIIDDIMKNQI